MSKLPCPSVGQTCARVSIALTTCAIACSIGTPLCCEPSRKRNDTAPLARSSTGASKWGAYLDSTLDRLGDAAIFGGLVLYYAGRGDSLVMASLALSCLILGSVVSYAKARAEGLGFTANVGIAERADRLVAVLAAAFFADLFDSTPVLGVVLALLAVASLITVVQRMVAVRRQALAVGEVSR